ncbi:hypothetical protein [Antarcticirhabdus aurantiaca]|uniref:Uncharacterized protein n=1 Tax=Antarcticirhabdus aurantiaca TaxID=2606717 RepID=A0ACD4NJY7_9HYPH|nr:hypothetical protein [Antarcticirhabdus aurantiaca]WAJ27134.1 hypothetical protein OXU80_20090 [Jeongeuplla avenae]
MANILYMKLKEQLLTTLASSTVKVVLIDTGAYTYSAAHEFLSSVPSGARIGTPQTLTSKTLVNGVFDASDVTIPNVPAGTGTGSAAEAILIYIDTGTESTSRLVTLIDAAPGLPVTPNGGNVVVTWAAEGIFAL